MRNLLNLTALISVICMAIPAFADDLEELYKRVEKVIVTNNLTKRFEGSSFRLTQCLWVTAAHVVRGEDGKLNLKSLRILSSEGSITPKILEEGDYVRTLHTNDDWMVLSNCEDLSKDKSLDSEESVLSSERDLRAHFSYFNVATGIRAKVIGFPFGKQKAETKDCEFLNFSSRVSSLNLNCHVLKGMSGGPVFYLDTDTQKWRYVGIASGNFNSSGGGFLSSTPSQWHGVTPAESPESY